METPGSGCAEFLSLLLQLVRRPSVLTVRRAAGLIFWKWQECRLEGRVPMTPKANEINRGSAMAWIAALGYATLCGILLAML